MVQCAEGARMKMAQSLTAAFICPQECLECCDTTWSTGWYKGFHCTLRDGLRLPTSRECKPATRRKSNPRQYKAQCSYLDSEDASAEKKCSKKFQCCCPEDNSWTESRCFAGADDSKTGREEISEHNGQLAFYKMAFPGSAADAQIIVNDFKPCQGDGSHHVYDVKFTPGGGGRPQPLAAHTEGCCLSVRTETVDHRWDTGKFKHGGDGHISHEHDQKEEKRTYTICNQMERLHACSEDGGITPNGKFLYNRVVNAVAGTCLGDTQTTEVGEASLKLGTYRDDTHGYCPAPMASGPWCTCDESCKQVRI